MNSKKKEPLKNKLFSKTPNYFWNACEELANRNLKKKFNFPSNLLEVFLKNTASESLY